MPFKNLPIILSASRMTDMPMYYPNEIIGCIEERLQKGQKIHSLVLWTKHPSSLINGVLYDYLKFIRTKGVQLFVHLTITGMGGKAFGQTNSGETFFPEPNVPDYEKSLEIISEIIKLTDKEERIRLRIDPILKIKDAKNNVWSNEKYFKPIIETANDSGIKNFTFSFLESGMHAKVDKRFSQIGYEIISPSITERIEFQKKIEQIIFEKKIQIFSCCVPHLQESRCIDGYLLENLHDFSLSTLKKEPKSRTLCKCTSSVDIGGWPPKQCNSGCFYCYSRPDFKSNFLK